MAASKSTPKKVGKPKPVAKKATVSTSKVLTKKATAKVVKPAAKAKSVVKSVEKKPLPNSTSKKQAIKKAAVKHVTPAVKKDKKTIHQADNKAQVKPAKATAKKILTKKIVTPATRKATNPVVATATKPLKTKQKEKEIATVKHSASQPVKNEAIPPSPTTSVMSVKKKEVKPTKIVIPKTTTKTAVKYEPDFTRSILDSNQSVTSESGAPIVRYSDSDLTEFRELIHRKLDAAKKELAYLQGLITHKDEMGGDNDDSRYMTMEDGSLSMEREQLSQMASRQITFVDHLEKALMRIENKTYGICRVTGRLIDKARLRAVPHATLSVEAKTGKVR